MCSGRPHEAGEGRRRLSGLGAEERMSGWVEMLLVLAVWWGLQAWLLPRLGVPT
jgi:hypothetical protein